MLQSGMTTNSFQNSGTAYSNSASSLFDPFSTKPFRLASSGTTGGPATTYDPKNNVLWATAQDTTEITQYMGPFPPPQWTLSCPSLVPRLSASKETWSDFVESVATSASRRENISSSAALTILGHAARLSSTFSASVKVIDPDVNGRNLSNHHLDQSARLMPLPQVGDICEAQYQGRRNRSSWGYRGVQITAVNVLDADMYEYTYDLQYPDGDSEAAVLPKHMRIHGRLLSDILTAHLTYRQKAISRDIAQRIKGHAPSILDTCREVSRVPFCVNVDGIGAEKLFCLLSSLLELASDHIESSMRNQGAAQPDQDDETYHAIIIFVNEILQANILASAHSGMKLSVSHKNLARLRDVLLRILAIFPQTAQTVVSVETSINDTDAASATIGEDKDTGRTFEKQKLPQSLAVISSSSARVLRAAPHIFFTSSKDVLSMIVSLPSLCERIENIDASISLVMGELCNLPRYVCINERGVAYRNSQDKFDRFESIRGPEPGHVIVALEIFDRLGRTTFKANGSEVQAKVDLPSASKKSSSADKPRSSGSTEGWIRVAVNDMIEKFLPLHSLVSGYLSGLIIVDPKDVVVKWQKN